MQNYFALDTIVEALEWSILTLFPDDVHLVVDLVDQDEFFVLSSRDAHHDVRQQLHLSLYPQIRPV